MSDPDASAASSNSDVPVEVAVSIPAPVTELTFAPEPVLENQHANTLPPPEAVAAPVPVSEPELVSPPPPPVPLESSPLLAPIKNLAQQALEKLQFRKKSRLEKIVALAQKKGSIVNDDVEKLLHVSDSTAQRYLGELVTTGKLRRSGSTTHIKYEPA